MNHTEHKVLIGLTESIRSEYDAVQASSGLFRTDAGILRLEGEDTLDFLQRLSTNDLQSLKEREHRATVFITEKGRIIDLAIVVSLTDGTVLLLTDGNGSRVKAWLEKYLIMENIRITDATLEFSRYYLVGTRAFVNTLNPFPDVSADNLVAFFGGGYILRAPLWHTPCYHILVRKDFGGTLLGDVGGLGDFIELGRDAMEVLRIENGIPQTGKELTEQVNPLEANLDECISFTKGCYLGQEVIARLDTYKKIQRKLKGLIFHALDEIPPVGGKLYFHGEEIGWTTSHTRSYKLDKVIGLGYLKTNALFQNIQFKNEGLSEPTPVEVTDLPF